MEGRSYTPPPPGPTAIACIPPYNPKTSSRSLDDWLQIVRNARNVWKWNETQTVQRAGAVLEGEAHKVY